jgi:3',5'-cyclic AMP phosphodiesterase CpdA
MSRREVLKAAGFAAAILAGAPHLPSAAAAPARLRRRALRIAHLTDTHTQPERRASEGLAACLRHVRELPEQPDLIITGGDHIMDAFATGQDRAKVQWDLWHKITRDECALPIESCIGNHDIWGWNKSKSQTTGEEALYGKKWAAEALRFERAYRSIDRGGWHIVFLDSVFPNGDGYLGKLDDEQFEWLAGDLASVNPQTPVLVGSHIPILSVAVLYFGGKDQRDKNEVNPSLMHIDAGRIHKLFLKHRNVKLCISGHLHLVDRCEYDGVTYMCNGAVSGNWWKGRHHECVEGYAILDLNEDGTFERRYVTYGWKVEGSG